MKILIFDDFDIDRTRFNSFHLKCITKTGFFTRLNYKISHGGESNGPSSTQLCTTQKFNLELFDRKRFSPRGENCCGKEHAEEEEI